DALLRLEMRSELKGLLRGIRTTTLYVTHDQTEAMSLADRIAIMHEGQIVQYDAPATVYVRPATTFVGGFIGNPPMNFLRNAGTISSLGLQPPVPGATLGIRPEDLELVSQGGLALRAEVVEMLGASQQVNTRVQDELIRISTHAAPAIVHGQSLQVRPKPARAHWYDASGRLLP
ncbi:MAG: ABC transporter ATP-binding protein, partial [Rhodoferax sp.]|nr:ABC transporter ATP-binding protein [Rhodoferax sp.]